MTRIIPATVLFDEHGDGPPKLVIPQGGSDLGELITERGIEIQESGDFMDDSPRLDPNNRASEPPEALGDKRLWYATNNENSFGRRRPEPLFSEQSSISSCPRHHYQCRA